MQVSIARLLSLALLLALPAAARGADEAGSILFSHAGSKYSGVAEVGAAKVRPLNPADMSGTTPFYITWRGSAWNDALLAVNVHEVGTDTYAIYAWPSLQRRHAFRLHQLVNNAFAPRYFGSSAAEFALSSKGAIAAVWENNEGSKAYVSVVDPSGAALVSNHQIYNGTEAGLAAAGARVAWFADGRRLLISAKRRLNEVYVVSAGRSEGYELIRLKGVPRRAISIDSLEVSSDDARAAMSVSVRYADTEQGQGLLPTQQVHKEIFVLGLESGAVTQLTGIPEAARGGSVPVRHNHPVWSPDGRRVLFSLHTNVRGTFPDLTDLWGHFLRGAPGACSPLLLIDVRPVDGQIRFFGPGAPVAKEHVLRLRASAESYLAGCEAPLAWMR